MELAMMQTNLETVTATRDTQQAARVRATLAAMPHMVYGCTVFNDGISWIARLEMAEGTTLVGRGNCPQAALMDFDNQWTGVK